MYKLLITDLDDTLYSWIGFFVPAFYAMVEELSIILNVSENQLLDEYKELHKKYGNVEHPFVTLDLPSVNENYAELSKDEIKLKLNSAFHKFNSIRKNNLNLYSEVSATLEKLYNNHIKIIGYTESAEENGLYRLKKLGIANFFDKVYVSDSLYSKTSPIPKSSKTILLNSKKPNPQILKSICDSENILLEETIYIGDSLTKDIFMASQANVKSVLMENCSIDSELYAKLVKISHWTDEDFDREKKLKEICTTKNIKPDFTISNFKEILNIVNVI